MAKRKKPISIPQPIERKLSGGVIYVIVTALALCCVAIQPISSDCAWWQLSCGRQVITQGSLWPSADLLVYESQGEANAIGTATATSIYLLLGASGWMLVRVAAVSASIILVVLGSRIWPTEQSSLGRNLPFRLAFLTISLAALSPFLDPVPMLFDLIATSSVAIWIIRRNGVLQESIRGQYIKLAILFLFWANFGDHVFVGLLMIAATELTHCWLILKAGGTWMRAGVSVLGIAVAALSATINPIGWLVWRDSFSITMPWAVAPPWTLVGTDWVPLTQTQWGFGHAVFLLLTLTTFLLLFVLSRQHKYFAVTLTLQLLAWASAVNMPMAIAWMAILLLSFVHTWPIRRTSLQPIAAVTAIAISAVSMVPTLGWGFDADLDPRMLEMAMADVRDDGTILTDDSRSSGMMAWVLGAVEATDSTDQNVSRIQDEPRRALVGGRLLEHRRLFADLRNSQQMSYWRDDESQGGWWLPLTQRKTSLVVCSRRDLKLIRRLEPTIWKPLSLDSPVLPYARAGDPIFTPKIVDVLGQRDFVNSGQWDFQPPASTGSVYDRDRFGLFSASEQPDRIFDQADVFAAMDLQIAALEVLDFARQRWSDSKRYISGWHRCQIEFADWERIHTGQASLMRTLASRPLEVGLEVGLERQKKFDDAQMLAGFEISDTEARHWERLISIYRQEGASVALQACELGETKSVPNGWESFSQSSREQLRYAAVCWAIESGRQNDAMRWAIVIRNNKETSQVVRSLAQLQIVSQNWSENSDVNSQDVSR